MKLSIFFEKNISFKKKVKMKLKNKNESLSDALLRWSIDFNENLALDKKDEKTIENYMNVVNKFIEYVSTNKNVDNLDFESIDVKMIKRYFAWRDSEHENKTGKELKASTKLNDKKILNIFFEYIEDENKDNFEFHLKWKKIKYKKESNEKEFYPPILVKQILDYLEENLKKNRDEFAYMLSFTFKLALYGGLRASEICITKISSFGVQYQSLETKKKLIPITILGKGKTKYTNPLPYEYIKNELNYFKRNKSNDEFIFLTKTGLPLKRTNLYGYFENISNELNLGKKGCHLIRRTFATNLSEIGIDVRNIQLLMRHKDIKTTTIYTARSQNRMDDAVSKL